MQPCNGNDCNEKYHCQGRRAIGTRYTEHSVKIKHYSSEKLSVAHHVLYSGLSADEFV